MIKSFQSIQTPAYVAHIAAIKRNLAIAARIKNDAGIEMVLALKAFSQFSAFAPFKEVLDGTTASGLYEAKLGAEEFGQNIHTYSPAYDDQEIEALIPLTSHLYFNSVSQLQRYYPRVQELRPDLLLGLRMNPQLSLVKNSALYDPSAPNSRFGALKSEITDDVLNKISGLHVHNLCENPAADTAKLVDHLIDNFSDILNRVEHLNLGGGHYFTSENYDVDALITALNKIKATFPHLHVILEPGGTLVYNAGYLVTRVLDIIARDEISHAILDSSASAHMPDVLEVPYRPPLMNSGEADEKAYTYILGGRTCMSGDVIGTYSFDAPLKIGDTLIFEDMAQYALVKNTTFNGIPLPDIGVLHENGDYERVKSFGYTDFKGRLS